MTKDIDPLLQQRRTDWIAFRRDLHRHPELGFTEFRTASLVAQRLEALGYSLRLGASVMRENVIIGRPPPEVIEAARQRALANGAVERYVAQMPRGLTGLVAEMKRGDGPVVAFRFDMDALPMAEETSEEHVAVRKGYASQVDCVMHACGHDAHTAIGLAVAEIAALSDLTWRGTLRLIFQPAEEGGRGAKPMVEAGVVDDVDWFFALHIGCDLPSGKIAKTATEMLFSTKWDVSFKGRAAHAAGNPEAGQNALLAACQATIALHGIPRHGLYATHVNVGTLSGGSGRNIVPALARMELEVRGNAEAALEHMERRAEEAISGAAAIAGCQYHIEPRGRTIGETSTPAAAGLVGDAARHLPNAPDVLEGWPLGGGDDAAYFMNRVKRRGGEAAYFILGSDLTAGHHAARFDLVEDDITTGARLFAALLSRTSAI